MKDDILLVFDCFGVLLNEVSSPFFNKYFKNNAKEMKDKYCVPLDLGIVTQDEVFEQIAADLSLDKNQLKKEWFSYLFFNEELVSYMKTIKEKATIVLLSNAGKGFLDLAFEMYGLSDLFDQMIISYQIGKVKPNKDIYEYLLTKVSHNYKKIMMLDDNVANLVVPQSLGWDTLQFQMQDTTHFIQLIDDYLK